MGLLESPHMMTDQEMVDVNFLGIQLEYLIQTLRHRSLLMQVYILIVQLRADISLLGTF